MGRREEARQEDFGQENEEQGSNKVAILSQTVLDLRPFFGVAPGGNLNRLRV
jgi:hypothetical protein